MNINIKKHVSDQPTMRVTARVDSAHDPPLISTYGSSILSWAHPLQLSGLSL